MGKRHVGGLLTALVAAVALTGTAITGQTAPQSQGWTNVTGTLAYKLSECGNLTLVTPVPDSNAVIAGVAGRGLWVNTSGTTWTRLSDVSSDRIANRPTWIVFDPTNPAIFWESGIYGAGIYKSTDGGKTVQRLGEIQHNDHMAVDFTDPDRKILLASGHEQSQTVNASFDGGKTWKNIGQSLPPGSGLASHPYAIDSMTYMVNIGTPDGAPLNGIYRTVDGGGTWQRVSNVGPNGAVLKTAKGVFYWAASHRMLRSTNGGVSWTAAVAEGLRAIHPVEMEDGKLVAVGDSKLLISADGGTTWSPMGPTLPHFPQPPDGLAYSPQRRAFFVYRGDCREHVPGNAIFMLQLSQ